MKPQDTSVHVNRLCVSFGEFKAVDDISFSVRRGEIFGFLGANGAGKTTTIRVLCGLLVPTSGEVKVAGFQFKDGADIIKRKVGYMSQKFTLYNDLTVQENLEFAAALRKMSSSDLYQRQKDLFEFVHFDRSAHTLVADLPGGMKQELSLVAALLHDPEIIFLDEPTAGVSPTSRTRFWDLIRQLSDAGKTVFVTTHHMDEAEECGRIALMRAGRIIALDTPGQLERQTFPELVVEVEPQSREDSLSVEKLKNDPAVQSFQPYGLRYHFVIKDTNRWETLVAKCGSAVKVRKIRPSLEDVFIRLVEEKGK